MKLAILGYGKMGQTIERLALEKGHEITLRIGSGNTGDLKAENLRAADAALEFSRPDVAFDNVVACLLAGVPVVSGTTAWSERLEEARALCHSRRGAFFYASNFSIGVNIFFAINRQLAALMNAQPRYKAGLEEIHHTQKTDHPSGTAITLANDILQLVSRKKNWVAYLEGAENETPMPNPEVLPIFSKRIGNTPGTHIVTWASDIDTIEICHTAHSREGFAAGAIAAAEWLQGRSGCFEMKDMLGF